MVRLPHEQSKSKDPSYKAPQKQMLLSDAHLIKRHETDTLKQAAQWEVLVQLEAHGHED
jgi:hypothetical protein